MAEKFTFKIDKITFPTFSVSKTSTNRSFKNKYGTWHIRVENDGKDSLQFLVVLVPANPQSEEALKGLNITVIGTCTGHKQNSFKKCACQIGNSPVYELSKYAELNRYEHSNYSFAFEIDASSLAHPASSSSSHSLAGHNKKMLEGSKLADITIKTEDGKSEIRASKFILTRSPVFDVMLNNHDTKEAQEGIIKIEDIQHEVMKEMIHSMLSQRFY